MIFCDIIIGVCGVCGCSVSILRLSGQNFGWRDPMHGMKVMGGRRRRRRGGGGGGGGDGASWCMTTGHVRVLGRGGDVILNCSRGRSEGGRG